MPVRTFGHVIPFTEARGEGWLPNSQCCLHLVEWFRVRITPTFRYGRDGNNSTPEFVEDFPPGEPAQANVGGTTEPVAGVVTNGTVEFMGHRMECEIVLLDLPANPLRAGLFGRGCFKPFGFGFWESTRELYVTPQP